MIIDASLAARHRAIRSREISPQELADIATEDEDPILRAHAAWSLRDAGLLKSAMTHIPEPVRGKEKQLRIALGELPDDLLLQVCLRVPRIDYLCIAALRKPESLDTLLSLRAAFKRKEDLRFAAINDLVNYSNTARLLTFARGTRDTELKESIISEVGDGLNRHSTKEVWCNYLEDTALNDADQTIRVVATEAQKSQIKLQTLLVQAADPLVRAAAARKSRNAQALLAAAQHDPDKTVRLSALRALARHPDEPEGLIDLTLDQDADIAAAAAAGLKRAGSVSTVLDTSRRPKVLKSLRNRHGWRVVLSLPSESTEDRDVRTYLLPPFMPAHALERPDLDIRNRPTSEVSDSNSGLTVTFGSLTAPLSWHPSGFAFAVLPSAPVSTTGVVFMTVWAGGLALAVAEVRDRTYVARHDRPEWPEKKAEWTGIIRTPTGRARIWLVRRIGLRIFASYAREDLEVVRMVQSVNQTLSVLRFEYDLEVLKSGDRWTDAVRKRIKGADTFQLFWSRAAGDSPAVEREWRFALSLRRANFVRPVFWGKTVGPVPPPPQELAPLHFQKILVPRVGRHVRPTAGPSK